MTTTEERPAILALSDGRVFHGYALGKRGSATGEVCFNTSTTGYQEILTDPSYRDQLITFTTPHIGNVGSNEIDMESPGVSAHGIVVRQVARTASNYRSQHSLNSWLIEQGVVGISGVDTRALTRHLRSKGAITGIISSDGTSVEHLTAQAQKWQGLQGRDLVAEATGNHPQQWRSEEHT
ncbi:MAG: carbamoyl-phosphate synthase domain-containing protein, partial [Mariprofundales bacterium]|nr:carbamoyl-phosphate synthase domain-containing protein [Mariprofundales bacterium]